MPAPTNPPCSGSWPEPPPEMMPTLSAAPGASARMHELVLEIDAHQPGMGGGHARERLGDDVLWIVDELLDDLERRRSWRLLLDPSMILDGRGQAADSATLGRPGSPRRARPRRRGRGLASRS